MTSEFFDVQAALLYQRLPKVDLNKFMMLFSERASRHGLPGPFQVLPGASNDTTLTFAGSGVHVTVAVQQAPLDKAAFELPLRAPILKTKAFDFRTAIETHEAGIVITVGDGETPLPVEVRRTMAESGIVQPADAFVKLSMLHMALQQIIAAHTPLMVDFCPSQSLLSPQEIASVAPMALPVPILFHPFPVRNQTGPTGVRRRGMAAIHAPLLIGADLELEAIPDGMPVATRINMLATLISLKMDGTLPLDHGDILEADDGTTQWVRHVAGSPEGAPMRIIVSYDTEAPETRPATPVRDQNSFHDRIARLKTRAQTTTRNMPMAAEGASLRPESEEDLRARVQEAIGPSSAAATHAGRSYGLPLTLMVVTALLGAFLLTSGGRDMAAVGIGEAQNVHRLMTGLGQQETVSIGFPTTDTTDSVQVLRNSFDTSR